MIAVGGKSVTQEWKKLFQIFWTFFKMGPVTFGGGYAMIPMIEREIVIKRKWLNNKDITDVLVIAQSTPGAIAINSAIFVGYRIADIKGAIMGLLGILLPTFTIVILLNITYIFVQENPIITAALQGASAAVVALITYAGIKIAKTAVYDKTTLSIVGITVVTLFLLHFNPVVNIVSGIGLGILIIKIKGVMGIKIRLEKEENRNIVS